MVVLGLLLLLGGAAVAGLQYLPVDLSTVGGAQEFLQSQFALYGGAGAAALGLILSIVGLLPGKKQATGSSPRRTEPTPVEAKPAPRAAKTAPSLDPSPAPQPAPAQVAAHETPKPAAPDPHLQTRQRISDLVTINNAIRAYHAKMGAYPAADGLQGEPDRGKNWVPGLVPEFLPELPRDPAGAADNNGPQYFYISDGPDYKLIAHGVSPDGSSVEVLGIKIDPARRNENGYWAYGFWTEGFEKF